MKDSALKRNLVRLVWVVVAAVLNEVLIVLTHDYSNAAWYPVIYLVLTTVRDVLDPKLPNLPKGK